MQVRFEPRPMLVLKLLFLFYTLWSPTVVEWQGSPNSIPKLIGSKLLLSDSFLGGTLFRLSAGVRGLAQGSCADCFGGLVFHHVPSWLAQFRLHQAWYAFLVWALFYDRQFLQTHREAEISILDATVWVTSWAWGHSLASLCSYLCPGAEFAYCVAVSLFPVFHINGSVAYLPGSAVVTHIYRVLNVCVLDRFIW